MSRGSRSSFPYHLRSYCSMEVSACGNANTIHIMQWRSVKRVTCKNCLKLIETGVETKWFKPKPVKEPSQ